MKVLHLSNDFAGSKVHSNLYKRLDAIGIHQTIFTAVFTEKGIGLNSFDGQNTLFYYAKLRDKWDSFLFRRKIRRRLHYIYNNIDLTTYDLVHATTLFSDGAIALKIHNKYGIPFVVAVRDCDISGFLSKAPHTWNIGVEILKKASAIVFITQALKDRFIKHPIIKMLQKQIENKIIIRPNGIDDFWLQHVSEQRTPFTPNFCYVGRLEKIKNVPKVINAILSLKEKIPDIHFDIVGGGGKDEAFIKDISLRYPSIIHYYGPISDKNELRSVYLKNNVFIMASHHETFGLVYIEALTQGLNIIYTKNEGIDGMFPPSVGIAVNSHEENDISNAIENIATNHQDYFLPQLDFSEYSWDKISKFYNSLYLSIISRNQ